MKTMSTKTKRILLISYIAIIGICGLGAMATAIAVPLALYQNTEIKKEG